MAFYAFWQYGYNIWKMTLLDPPPNIWKKNHIIFFAFKMLFRHFYDFLIFSPCETQNT